MIRSRFLNVLVVSIGAVFLVFAVSYGLEASQYFVDGVGDAGTIAFFYTCLAIFHVAIAIWCIRGGFLNLRSVRRQRL